MDKDIDINEMFGIMDDTIIDTAVDREIDAQLDYLSTLEAQQMNFEDKLNAE